ncbi:MAG: Hsp70 family protein [Prevotellaceae bacterium]|jgi:molecular chaperone DnaK (HSP70)|nr:Hsp70 family protein [Prevotellaceae bacterium]
MSDSKKVYGIDLGTTYSCVATIDDIGKPVVLKNGEGDDVTPSVVFYESADKVIVGDTAKNEVDAKRRVSFIKREIGNDNFASTCMYPEDPVTVSAYILKKLVQDANMATMQEINDVVITCPAYFGTKERMQTQQAGEIAGLNVLSIINEPTAAAISYGLTTKEDKVVLVYDLGGGTFDVTLIDVSNAAIRVVATGGDSRLGGADWDREIVKYLATQFEDATGLSDILSDPETEVNLYLQAEKAKKMLTTKDSYKSTIVHDGTSEKIELTRETFESLTSNLLSRTISILDGVLAAAKEKDSKYSRFDEVLLVGGSCRMPQVKKIVDEKLGSNAKMFDPDQAVAKGAAMYAMFQQEYNFGDATDKKSRGIGGGSEGEGGGGGQEGPKIVNVLSKSYGIGSVLNDLKTKVISTMVFEQDELPLQASNSFVTVQEGQSRMQIDVYEVSATRNDKITDDGDTFTAVPVEDGTLLDGALLDFGKGFPKGHPVSVTIALDAEGMMDVTAHEEDTGKKIRVQIKITGVRTKEEVQQAAARMKKVDVGG